jgi:hypothetical protein
MKLKRSKRVTLKHTYVPDFFGSSKSRNILVPPIIKNEPEPTHTWKFDPYWLFIGILLIILLSQITWDIKFEFEIK